ncbi:hypothetical protein BDV38DRAFT_280715 [Aspergillus pseudotamarii]|uniref:Alpha-galactosidase A n=1 Tax=Aspergillus pseudotamarii TaxID=132259 RepID=A0A5N6T0U8_ASPPS|nr:uncharacterized protein BDV38DRAFT_280715 [Aspergillus pseudotamarii]KAE8139799.1 hypothetical protein BDV38DRAFT_280715 [Aspergillus pseudotamarii]
MAIDRLSYPTTVLSMEVDGEDDSEYRILFHGRILYVTIALGTRDNLTGGLKTLLSTRVFPSVKCIWHASLIDCMDLTKTRTISPNAFEVTCPLTKLGVQDKVIAKLARFEWEIQGIERETQAYKMLERPGLAPRFVGYVHEHGRMIDLVLEKLEGRHGYIEDLSTCQALLQRFHALGLLHGDVNRYNFIVQQGSAKLIDFEHSRHCPREVEAMNTEISSFHEQLVEEPWRGAGIIFKEIEVHDN